MAGFVDSDDYAQFGAFMASDQDLELQHMSTYYPHVPVNASNGMHGTFTAQYNYPPPSFADNYRQNPYPDPTVRTSEQIAACFTPSNAYMNSAWTQNRLHTYNPTVAPSQTTLRHEEERDDAYNHTNNTTGIVIEIDQNIQPAIPSQPQMIIPYQDHVYPQQLSEFRMAIQPIADTFRDDSTPYVAGYVAGREVELQRKTDVLTAVVERPSFACDICPKKCKTKSDLSHHKVTHDNSKRRRHKCNDCPSAFRYPKDLKRHTDAKHSEVQLFCADCDKVYKRKDHLDRHTRSKGHVAAPDVALLLSASPSSPTPSMQASDRSATTAASRVDSLMPSRPYGFSAQLLSHNRQSTSNLDPSLLQAPLIPSASLTTGSVDDTFTVSEVESIWSQDFRFV